MRPVERFMPARKAETKVAISVILREEHGCLPRIASKA